ncbi:protease pro-enzyme activation domain-containing protein [Dactylosporangium siamense]|uniref:Serine protease n=1 Tax=Dactylosporangium siamense TaxID=685454 RepID=A0A919PYP1_9ACTN|nr:S53 family peptidase [Dactylosporangium siamense]GIG53175.1 serine protease [Dactylosporangium siamense]
MRRSPLTAAVAAVASAAAVLAFASTATAAPSSPGGIVPDSAPITLTLTLAADPSEVSAAATAVATPGSATFGKHLTREQVRDRYGASIGQVDRVTRWAKRVGFQIADLDDTRSRLTITGTARQARAAFGTQLRDTTRNGVRVRSAVSTPRVPSAIRAEVRAVSGMTQQVAKPLIARPAAVPTADGQYCSAYWAQYNKASVPQKHPAGAQSNILCGYNGEQLRAMYGLGATDRGQGQTIVIVGAFHNPTVLADANATFRSNAVPELPADRLVIKQYNLPGGAPGCDRDSWYAEQALDVQTVHTLAPDAKIIYAAAPDCTQLEETVAAVIADPSIDATVISASWGLTGEPNDPAYLTATNTILARAALLGIGFYAGSGDWGDNSSLDGANGPSAMFPASSPWATAVGGTSTGLNGNNQIAVQTGWESAGNVLTGGTWKRLNPPLVGGAGGGPSHFFDKPTWQANLPGTKRMLPDVAALADPYTGFYVGYTVGGQYRAGPIGGTSLATPIIASLTAVAQARTGGAAVVGLAAPILYSKTAAGKAIVTDVNHVDAGIWTPATAAGQPSGDYLLDLDAGVQSLKTRPGYDPVTGLGVPGPAYLTELVG